MERFFTRILYGPLRLLDVTARCGSATTTSCFLWVGVENSDSTDATQLPPGNNVFGPALGDKIIQAGAFSLTLSPQSFPLNRAIIESPTRLVVCIVNSAGSAQDVAALIRVQHMNAEPRAEIETHQ